MPQGVGTGQGAWTVLPLPLSVASACPTAKWFHASGTFPANTSATTALPIQVARSVQALGDKPDIRPTRMAAAATMAFAFRECWASILAAATHLTLSAPDVQIAAPSTLG